MAQATVKTVQYLDPRIEPQPDPVYDYVIGPTQNQYYRIPASGFSQSSITFNNLTTLGIDRAYLDTFELELSATITFELSDDAPDDLVVPQLSDWTFQSFPFNTCCEEARVNINGGAFFSQPMCYVRAKERYMNQYDLSKSYQNICPVHRPETQYESGRRYDVKMTPSEASTFFLTGFRGNASRYGAYHRGYMQSSEGIIGGDNMSFIDYSKDSLSMKDYPPFKIERKDSTDGTKKYLVVGTIVWREPIFVSPFSSRYDATYGRPLYNITSMDLSFNLCSDLGNMIRLTNWYDKPGTGGVRGNYTVKSYSVHLDTACLCYQVMTIPPILNKPLTTLVPYRRFVPYITEYNKQGNTTTTTAGTVVDVAGDKINMSSGVYTFNEIPTAIWVFVAPVKDRYQTNKEDVHRTSTGAVVAGDANAYGNWDSNKLFGFLKKVNISMANTTQILATAKPSDLYRIAKANGCEDSAVSWLNPFPLNTTLNGRMFTDVNGAQDNWPNVDDAEPEDNFFNVSEDGDEHTPEWIMTNSAGAGSVLRLKPGVDIIVPDQPLIPGANANNMVFQVEVDAIIPPNSFSQVHYALWLLFEYVGVAAISPGQCEITMNPLGSGEIMAVSPVMSATSDSTEGNLEGSGFWDNAKKHTKILGQLADDGIISMILKRIPGAKGAAEWAKKHGLGEPACKRGRGGAVSGGAVIGKGLNDWV